jgi:hypothetical protein
MKKILAFIMVCVMALMSFVGCGRETTTITQETEVVETVAPTNDINGFVVEIKTCEIATDYEGNPIAIVTYGFTNNSDEAAAFYTSITAKAYQGGIETETCYFVGDDVNYNADNSMKEIKPGATLDVQEAYVLNDTTSDLEIEVSDWLGFSNTVITKTFTLV